MDKEKSLEKHLQYVPIDRVEEFKILAEKVEYDPSKLQAISKAMRMNVCKKVVASLDEKEDTGQWLVDFLQERKKNSLTEYFHADKPIQLVNGEILC